MNDLWQVDECPDANGYVTIRLYDGSPNGNTQAPPIATVYDAEVANHIVVLHNRNTNKD
jgi:hypothetical protein